jgi:hypothetical protein
MSGATNALKGTFKALNVLKGTFRTSRGAGSCGGAGEGAA